MPSSLAKSRILREAQAHRALHGKSAVYVRTMAIFVAVWEAIALIVGNPLVLPAPGSVASSFAHLLADGSILADARTSLSRLVIAYALAIGIGFPIGILMALSRPSFQVLDPIVELLRPISAIAWIPISLVILGVGTVLPIFILVYVAIFPVILNTIAGVRGTNPTLIKAARTMGVPERRILWQVILPSSLPPVLTGLRLSAGLAWLALIASELVGTTSGLGYAIEFYASLFRISDMVALIAIVALLGYLTDLALRVIQRSTTPWAVT